ncbi:hypothetical protein GCM10010441_46030 [Kitasatospora paracochleata]|uniref:Uncharacterized protein n=1 Tax=Kitasatospora paracochleata TaxID=58354 RepID=A0ABT1J6C4_9ACTN|nr:hypothetical protein [Kitasatospora paracochleata]MCP2312981.1 hypothetical protein [Kitasatospora paracochleata]
MKLKFAAFSLISALALGGIAAAADGQEPEARNGGGTVGSALAGDIIWPAPSN